MQGPHAVRVAIDGPDAAGKSVLADELAAAFRERPRAVVRRSIDDFLRPQADRHVFVSVGFEEILRRAVLRDAHRFGSAEEVERRYRTRYIPGQRLYLAATRPELVADAVVYNDDPSRPLLRVRTPS